MSRRATTGVRHRTSSRGKCAETATIHPSSRRAGTRAGRRASVAAAARLPLRAEHRVGRARRRAAELSGRDRPDAALDPASSKIASRELEPGALAVGGHVPDPALAAGDEPAHRCRQMPDVRRGSRPGRPRRRPRRARGRAAASSGRSCGRSARRATTSGRSSASSPAAPSACSFERPYAESGFGRSDSTYGERFAPVEDVVGRERHERRAELGRMTRAADVRRRRALRVVLGAVHVRPRGGVEHEIGRLRQRQRKRQRDVPVRPRQRGHVVGRELLGQRVPELPAGARDQDAAAASRSDRIGDRVLQRSTTRGSSHGTPCSSGSAGSYSSVTW